MTMTKVSNYNSSMKAKHTPGPWRIAAKNFDTSFYVIHGNDEAKREVQVVKMSYGTHPIPEFLERKEADARLIAAAPELLSALVRLVNWAKAHDAICFIETKDIESAKAAIAKATGEKEVKA
jgi:hypothetical protein